MGFAETFISIPPRLTLGTYIVVYICSGWVYLWGSPSSNIHPLKAALQGETKPWFVEGLEKLTQAQIEIHTEAQIEIHTEAQIDSALIHIDSFRGFHTFTDIHID